MEAELEEKVKACTSEELRALLEQLTIDQIRFVVARQEYPTDREAAQAIALSVRTVYNWPDTVKEAARLMAQDGLIVAQYLRRRTLAKAMLVKVGGLDAEDERMRQNVATEIIEWEMGKATQKQEITGAEGGAVVVKFISNVGEQDI